MGLTRNADILKSVATRLGHDDFKPLLMRPGVNEALRIIIYYHDGRLPHSVATLQRGSGAQCDLRVSYDAYDRAGKPFHYDFQIAAERYQSALKVLRQNRFDQLDDDEDVPGVGVDVWLLARGSGSFSHDIVLSPTHSRGHYREVVTAFRSILPEAVRELSL